MKTKTKTQKPKSFLFNDYGFTVHNGVVYFATEDEFNAALAGTSGYRIEEYNKATVADIKKVAGIYLKIDKAIAALDKARGELSEIMVFNETPTIDEDGDLTVGCQYFNPEDTRNFLKKI